MTNEYAFRLRQSFLPYRDEAEAGKLSKYMRDQFEFIGLRAPQMHAVSKQFVQADGVPDKSELHDVIKTLWLYDEREMQMAALYVLEKTKPNFEENDIHLLEHIVVHKSWWDTIDHIAKHLIGYYFQLFPEKRDAKVEEWLGSGNIWLVRCAILFQLGYKEKTDAAMLEHVIAQSCGTKEFFINKAIGWALREYRKVNPDFVDEMVAKYPLSPLSRREALKHQK